MAIIAICQEMGWTYYQYIEQPNWFLELLTQKMIIDSEKIKKEIKKNQSSLKNYYGRY